MKNIFLGINWFAWQNIFIALPIFFVVFFLLIWKLKKTRMALDLLSSSSLLLQGVSKKRHLLKIFLKLIGLFFLLISLLRPQWGKKNKLLEQRGRDIFIALDISRSMLVQDCNTNRLEFAKKKIRSLLEYLDCERIGLILFSGSTCVQCPLTNDYSAFFMFLNQLDVETISSGTTAIDEAIKKALYSFRSMPSRKNKLLILLTDGEDFSSNLAGVREQAAKEGMTIFALGLGTTEGGPIPLLDENGNLDGYQKNADGKVIISRLNEGILHNLADQTGGTYLKLTDDDSDIKVLIKCVRKFEKEKFEDKEVFEFQERYTYFVVISLICFLFEWIL